MLSRGQPNNGFLEVVESVILRINNQMKYMISKLASDSNTPDAIKAIDRFNHTFEMLLKEKQ
jgi:hypothetical protein